MTYSFIKNQWIFPAERVKYKEKIFSSEDSKVEWNGDQINNLTVLKMCGVTSVKGHEKRCGQVSALAGGN